MSRRHESAGFRHRTATSHDRRDANSKLFASPATVALGGFLVGFDATVISGAVPFIRDYFGLRGSAGSLKLGWAVSCLGWGAMAGNLAAGPLSDRFGRRSVLLLTSVLFLASSLTAALSTRFAVFVAARICGGLGGRRGDSHRPGVHRGDRAGAQPRKPGLPQSVDDCHRHLDLVLFQLLSAVAGRG